MDNEIPPSDQPVFIDVENGLDNAPKDIPKEMEVKEEEESYEEYNKTLLQIQPRKLRCPECPRYTTETVERMTRHILKVHRGENPFQCFMCDYSTTNKGNFEDHVRRHEGSKPYKCSLCPHRTVSKKTLKKHERIHRPDNPLKCPHCDHIARHRKGFAFHAKRFHSEQDGGLTCVKCDSSFDDVDAAKRHRKCQKVCKNCKYVACSDGMLDKHYFSKHGKKRVRKIKGGWVCAICSWKSTNHPKILLHLIHHPNQIVNDIDISILKRHNVM